MTIFLSALQLDDLRLMHGARIVGKMIRKKMQRLCSEGEFLCTDADKLHNTIEVGNIKSSYGFVGEELALECIFRSLNWGGL